MNRNNSINRPTSTLYSAEEILAANAMAIQRMPERWPTSPADPTKIVVSWLDYRTGDLTTLEELNVPMPPVPLTPEQAVSAYDRLWSVVSAGVDTFEDTRVEERQISLLREAFVAHALTLAARYGYNFFGEYEEREDTAYLPKHLRKAVVKYDLWIHEQLLIDSLRTEQAHERLEEGEDDLLLDLEEQAILTEFEAIEAMIRALRKEIKKRLS